MRWAGRPECCQLASVSFGHAVFIVAQAFLPRPTRLIVVSSNVNAAVQLVQCLAGFAVLDGQDGPLAEGLSLHRSDVQMSRNKDFYEPRRRGFDDDERAPIHDRGGSRRQPRMEEPPMSFPTTMSSSTPASPEMQATVKWFNAEKGFGFVELADGSGDAFLHVRALEQAGHSSVDPGTKLRARVGQGQKGRQITEILGVDASTAEPRPARPAGGGGGGGGPRFNGPMEEGIGTVKWYNPDKGFGFITPESGGKDVFVHATVLTRSGLAALAEGQRVRMKFGQGVKGPEARSIELAD
ncbi:MAG: cold-shock protein [Bauldia sp.]